MLNYDSFYKVQSKRLIIQCDDETVGVAFVDEESSSISFFKIMIDGADDDIKKEAMEWGIQNLAGLPKIVWPSQKCSSHGVVCEKIYQKGLEDGKREILDINRKFYSQIAKKLDNVLDVVQTILDEHTKKLLIAEIKETRDIIQAEIFSSLTDPLTKLFKKDVFEKIAGNRDEDAIIALTTDSMNVSLSRVKTGDFVYMVDLNNFKPINDQLGHDVGDQTLAIVGEEMLKKLAPMKCFRVGGDEFIIISDAEDGMQYDKVNDFFKKEISEIIKNSVPAIMGSGFEISGSVGCVEYSTMPLIDLKHKLSRNTEIAKMFDKLEKGRMFSRSNSGVNCFVDVKIEEGLLQFVKDNQSKISEEKLVTTLRALMDGDNSLAKEILKLSGIKDETFLNSSCSGALKT